MNIFDKAHIKHSIDFVKNEEIDTLQLYVTLIHQVEQSPGCGNENIDASRKNLDLWSLTNATKYNCVFESEKLTIRGKALTYLRG